MASRHWEHPLAVSPTVTGWEKTPIGGARIHTHTLMLAKVMILLDSQKKRKEIKI